MIDELRAEGFNARDLAVELRERTRNPDISIEDVRSALDMLVNEGTIREGSNGSYRKIRR
jgi:Fe2+ or Zn2+ uptake regulation protein